jgi:HAAS domain-containing protein
MSAPHAEQTIEGYLARLRAAAADLPAALRSELVDDVRSHVAEARARARDETDATILNILDRLGEPGLVVADARERLGIRPSTPYRPGLLEVAAIILLPFAWPIGVILLWVSPAWNRRDKLIGTLVPPGGYLSVLGVGLAASGTGGSSICASQPTAVTDPIAVTCNAPGPSLWFQGAMVLIGLVIFALPLITAAYLAVRLRWGRRTQVALTSG